MPLNIGENCVLTPIFQLRAYIAQDSPRYAAQFIARLIHAVEQLPDFPQRGRVVPEVNQDSLRELIFHGYRILYRLDNDSLRIVTVVHGTRDLTGLQPAPWEG